MNPNIKIFLLCPVPESQKPINEYITLKDNFLVNWASLSKKSYYTKITNLYITFLIVSSFFTFPTFSFSQNNIIQYIIFNLLITNTFILFIKI